MHNGPVPGKAMSRMPLRSPPILQMPICKDFMTATKSAMFAGLTCHHCHKLGCFQGVLHFVCSLSTFQFSFRSNDVFTCSKLDHRSTSSCQTASKKWSDRRGALKSTAYLCLYWNDLHCTLLLFWGTQMDSKDNESNFQVATLVPGLLKAFT